MTRDFAAAPTVGIVGAGQLARMTIQAAISLDVPIRVLAERPDDSAALVVPNVTVGPPSGEALAAFASTCDVLTFDHELVDADRLALLEAEGRRVRPSAATVALAQDKQAQRSRLGALGFPMPPNRVVRAAGDVTDFAGEHGWPLVAKARRGGYDGRGVWVLDDGDAAQALMDRTVAAGIELLVEPRVPLDRELAVIVARRPGGEAVAYPTVETVQVDGICHEILAPAPVPSVLAAEAQDLARAVADAVGAVGILAVELFVVGDRLLINELAARPHNSGHYSIDGCPTSQFENHLRAILDWPLGDTELVAPAVATANVLGASDSALQARLPEALAVPGVRVHLYGKAPRAGRKLGHVTALGRNLDEVRGRSGRAASRLAGRTLAEVPR